MPNYDVALTLQSLYPGQIVLAFDGEQPAPPQASQRYGIPSSPLGQHPPSVNIDIQFSADPGVFELAVQEADVDEDADYMTVPSAGTISAVDANFRARTDLFPFTGKFIRLLLVSRTNAVNLTARISKRT